MRAPARRPAIPSPSQVTASSGMPATIPTAFQVPAATRIQPAPTSPKNACRGGRPERRARARSRKVATPSAKPTSPTSASSWIQKFCTPQRLLARRVGLRPAGRGSLRFAVGEVGLVAVRGALEADAEDRVVEPDAEADVGEHRALRAGLDVGARRLAGMPDAEEGEIVGHVEPAQRGDAGADDDEDARDATTRRTVSVPDTPSEPDGGQRGQHDAQRRRRPTRRGSRRSRPRRPRPVRGGGARRGRWPANPIASVAPVNAPRS